MKIQPMEPEGHEIHTRFETTVIVVVIGVVDLVVLSGESKPIAFGYGKLAIAPKVVAGSVMILLTRKHIAHVHRF